MPERSAHLAGIGLMLLAMLMFSLNDALGKWLVATYTVAQILLLRSIAALAHSRAVHGQRGVGAVPQRAAAGLQLLRALLATAEIACFYFSVWYLPLADAMTFYLAGPIYVTALSALFLGEGSASTAGGRCSSASSACSSCSTRALETLGTGSLIALAGSSSTRS